MAGLLVARRGSLHRSAAAADAYAAEVLADSPVAYWWFKETSGSTVNDEQSATDATVVGADLSTVGPTGTGATFDGVDDYIETNRQPLPATCGAITAEMLIRTSAASGSRMLDSYVSGARGWVFYLAPPECSRLQAGGEWRAETVAPVR